MILDALAEVRVVRAAENRVDDVPATNLDYKLYVLF
jgi:hypothetical protein